MFFQIANHINLRKRPGGLDHDMTFYFRTIRKLNGISSFWCRRQHYYAICCLAFLFLDVDIFRLISFCQSVFKFDIPNNLNCNYRVFHPLKAQLWVLEEIKWISYLATNFTHNYYINILISSRNLRSMPPTFFSNYTYPQVIFRENMFSRAFLYIDRPDVRQ